MEGRLSPAEASRYIEEHWGYTIHPETIRRWVRCGHIDHIRTPAGYILIDPAELERVHHVRRAVTNDYD
jgi:hypothetical protein